MLIKAETYLYAVPPLELGKDGIAQAIAPENVENEPIGSYSCDFDPMKQWKLWDNCSDVSWDVYGSVCDTAEQFWRVISSAHQQASGGVPDAYGVNYCLSDPFLQALVEGHNVYVKDKAGPVEPMGFDGWREVKDSDTYFRTVYGSGSENPRPVILRRTFFTQNGMRRVIVSDSGNPVYICNDEGKTVDRVGVMHQ